MVAAVKKWVSLSFIGVVSLLSIAAGSAKLSGVPSEKAFFEALGLGTPAMMTLGAIQLIAGLAMLIPKTRVYAAPIAAVAFLASSVMIFTTGNFGFMAVSLLPVLAALSIGLVSRRLANHT